MEKAFKDRRDPRSIAPQPMHKESYHQFEVTPDRLQEGVPNSTFNLQDLVYSVQHNKPFAQKIKVPLTQIKVLLYYGFLGKPHMITMDVEKELLRMNIEYEYMRTGVLLKELAGEGLVEMEEREAKKSKQRYYLWKFPSQNCSFIGKP